MQRSKLQPGTFRTSLRECSEAANHHRDTVCRTVRESRQFPNFATSKSSDPRTGWKPISRLSRLSHPSRARFAFIGILFFCAAMTGCCPHPPPTTQPYYGVTEPMDSVIAAINQNNLKISSLWSELNYSATLVNRQKNTSDSISGDGAMMYMRPQSLLIHGNAALVGQVIELGSNDTEFWVKIRGENNTFNYWWGHYANLGKPGCQPIPIRPDLVLQVLGVGLYGADFLREPVPVMRFDNDHDAYVFDRMFRGTDRWQTAEEIWYDRQTKRPTRVLLYGDGGRIQLQAELSNHTGVKIDGVPQAQWPIIARHFEMLAPDSGTRISFEFQGDPELQHTNDRGRKLPTPEVFERSEPDADTKVIQIDKDVANSAAMARH
jgi:hypothetical protein